MISSLSSISFITHTLSHTHTHTHTNTHSHTHPSDTLTLKLNTRSRGSISVCQLAAADSGAEMQSISLTLCVLTFAWVLVIVIGMNGLSGPMMPIVIGHHCKETSLFTLSLAPPHTNKQQHNNNKRSRSCRCLQWGKRRTRNKER